MTINLGAALLRGPMFKLMVRDECVVIRNNYGDQGHAFVIDKLARKDLTTRYRAVLKEVEKRLRHEASARRAA
jgi:hypothetical protein